MRRLGLGLVALGLVLTGPAATAGDDLAAAVDAFTSGHSTYVAPSAGDLLSNAQLASIQQVTDGASPPIFVAVLGERSFSVAQADARTIIDRVHADGSYIVVGQGGFLIKSDEPRIRNETTALAHEATRSSRDLGAEVVRAVQLVNQAAPANLPGHRSHLGAPPLVSPDAGGGGNGVAIFLFVVIGVIVVVVVATAVAGRRRTAAAFAEVRKATDEDVTALGEELTALDVPPSSAPEAVTDYQAALDAYDRAKQRLAAARTTDDLGGVTNDLEEGRWRLACVRARLANKPLPERRAPCFFNPRHGPSTTDVDWAPDGGVPRRVPVCAADAERIARGEQPESRMVTAGGVLVPYWRGPWYFRPYAAGFYGGWGGGAFLAGVMLADSRAGMGGHMGLGYGVGPGPGAGHGRADFASRFGGGAGGRWAGGGRGGGGRGGGWGGGRGGGGGGGGGWGGGRGGGGGGHMGGGGGGHGGGGHH